MSDWRQHHANEAEKAVLHPLTQRVVDELLLNLGRARGGLAEYGILKVAQYAASVARAQALGFDPDLLRGTPEEINEALIERARRAAESGIPVWVVEIGDEDVAP